MEVDLSLALVVVASSFSMAMLALHLMGRRRPERRVTWAPLDRTGDPVAFLFQGNDLVDSTPEARALLETGPAFLDDLNRLTATLEGRFPDLREGIAHIADHQKLVVAAQTGDAEVEAEWRGGLIRLVVHDRAGAASTPTPDRFTHEALSDELATLRGVIDDAPVLVWKEDSSGAVRWANGPYVDLVNRLQTEDEPVGWPLPRVFGDRPTGPDPAEQPRRLSVTMPDQGEPLWFDSFAEQRGGETLVFALPADKLVRAEGALREFVQTLTKTFAHLPTGLAVFDRERRLALFNPALTDLSSLEPQFLSARPTLFEFLDRLREQQRMPEPKDYKSWREQIAAMETAAASGTHQETWSLPTGQTFRVTGRPHPDGALAFLFEDISAEISLTRRFRAELELGQSVIDSLDEAIAVFSSTGTMILCNAAYERMWDHAPGDTLGETGIVEATRRWQGQCRPTPVWGDLRDFVGAVDERAEWTADITMQDGTEVSCRFAPIAGHATLVGFRQPDAPHTPEALASAASRPAQARAS